MTVPHPITGREAMSKIPDDIRKEAEAMTKPALSSLLNHPVSTAQSLIMKAILAERERIAKKYEAIAAQYPECSEIAKDKLFQDQWVREDW